MSKNFFLRVGYFLSIRLNIRCCLLNEMDERDARRLGLRLLMLLTAVVGVCYLNKLSSGQPSMDLGMFIFSVLSLVYLLDTWSCLELLSEMRDKVEGVSWGPEVRGFGDL